MDEVLVAASVTVPLIVALAWVIWFLVASSRRERQPPRTAHLFRGQGEAVTVAELVEAAVEQGDGLRLNWSDEDKDQVTRWPGMRPYVQDQVGTDFMRPMNRGDEEWPTAVLPKVTDIDEHDGS